MKTSGQWMGWVAALCWIGSSMFAACARPIELSSGVGGSSGEGGSSGSGNGSSTGSGSGSGEGGSSIPPGQTGSPCTSNDQCTAGMCTQVGNKKFCTVPCPPDCPPGTYCSIIQGDPICIPDLDQQCAKCTSSADCAMPTDQCFKAPAGDTFCSRDCTTDGICPNGFTCVEGVVYQGGGMNDDPPDGGDGGMKPPSGMPFKWCVPSDGASCPCNEKRDGISHTCHNVTASGDCTGKETCDGDAGKWVGCTAGVPSKEACNGNDDDCNGMFDDGDQNELCAGEGPKPPHGNWMCDQGTCKVGKCDPGWSAYPPGPPGAGCSCPLEIGEPNGTCNSVVMAGSTSDAGPAATLQGTLSAVNDVDIWRVETVDTPQGGANSYHVSIDFTTPVMNGEFVMDVIRGETCVAAPSGPASGITSYDWCVDGNGGPQVAGEAPCGEGDNLTHCGDHSSIYFVRVYRKLGVTGSCTPYTITVSGHGGPRPCDFSKKCEM